MLDLRKTVIGALFLGQLAFTVSCSPDTEVEDPLDEVDGGGGGQAGSFVEPGAGGAAMGGSGQPVDALLEASMQGGSSGAGASGGSGLPNGGSSGSNPNEGEQSPLVKGLKFVDGNAISTAWVSEGGGATIDRVFDDVIPRSPPIAVYANVNNKSWTEFSFRLEKKLNVADAKYFSFWIKVSGLAVLNTHWKSDDGSCGNTFWNPGIGVPIKKYNRDFTSGKWEHVVIPAVEIHQNKTACQRATEITFRGPGGTFEMWVDDVGFYFDP